VLYAVSVPSFQSIEALTGSWVAITRSFTLLYCLALLSLLTRIQLNLLGRRTYLSSVISLATGAPEATISLENNDDDNQDQVLGNVDFDVNRKYLTFSWWLLNRGWADVRHRVETAVRQVFGHLSPRDQLSFESFTVLTRQVRRLVENESSGAGHPMDWLPCMLPPPGMEDSVLQESGILGDSAFSMADRSEVAAGVRRLLDETSDLVESPTFSHVLSLLLDAGFSSLLDKKLAPQAFDVPAPPAEGNPELSRLRTTRTVLLPKILSILTRQAHAIGHGMPNEYLSDVESVRELEAFAAVVYSSNWENEVRDEGFAAEAAATGTANAAPVGVDVRLSEISGGDESLVVVDPSQGSLETAWEKAVGSK